MNTSKLLKIFINGEVYIINFSSLSVYNFKDYLFSNQVKTITEYNHTIIQDKEDSYVSIKSYDKVEFISIVGGG